MKGALHSKDKNQNPHQIVRGIGGLTKDGWGEWLKQRMIRSLYAVESKTPWEGQTA